MSSPNPVNHEEACAAAAAAKVNARKGIAFIPEAKSAIPAHYVIAPEAVPSPSELFNFNAETALIKLQSNVQIIHLARQYNVLCVSARRVAEWLIVSGWAVGGDTKNTQDPETTFWYNFTGGKFSATEAPTLTGPEVFCERFHCLF